MTRPRWLLAGLILLAVPLVFAQSSGGSYTMPRQSIDGGAQRAQGGAYTLDGSIGQADAGPISTLGSYQLRGGFHRAAGEGSAADSIFADGFEP